MKISSLIIFSLIIMSCSNTTKSLWDNPVYKEQIASFLITEDGNKLVIIGSKYHYIFKLQKDLKSILLSEKRTLLNPSFHSFKVDKNNNISGNFSLYYSGSNDDDVSWFKKSVFKFIRSNKKNHYYQFSGNIVGIRYSAENYIENNSAFKKSYAINVEEPSTFIGNVGKTLATPVAVAADGVKTIAGIILIPILAIVLTNKH